MKKKFAMLVLAIGTTFCIGGCAIEHGEDWEIESGNTYTEENTADVDVSGCFIVHAIGVGDFDVTDFTNGVNSDLTINTYDLDDKELGEWVAVGGEEIVFELCRYSYLYDETANPENWYLIKPSEGCKVAVEGACIYDIAYDGEQVITGKDYDLANGSFLLFDDGTVEFVDWTRLMENIGFDPVTIERGLPVRRKIR